MYVIEVPATRSYILIDEMEAPALVDLGPRLVPVAIRHARLGLAWGSCGWSGTGRLRGTAMLSGLRPRRSGSWCVSGPLPGSPSEEGEFIMTVRRYGDRPGWWISPHQVRQ